MDGPDLVTPYARFLYPQVDLTRGPAWSTLRRAFPAPELQVEVLERCIAAHPARSDYRLERARQLIADGLYTPADIDRAEAHVSAGLAGPDRRGSHAALRELLQTLDEVRQTFVDYVPPPAPRVSNRPLADGPDAIAERFGAQCPDEAMALYATWRADRHRRGLHAIPVPQLQETMLGYLAQVDVERAHALLDEWRGAHMPILSGVIRTHPTFADHFPIRELDPPDHQALVTEAWGGPVDWVARVGEHDRVLLAWRDDAHPDRYLWLAFEETLDEGIAVSGDHQRRPDAITEDKARRFPNRRSALARWLEHHPPPTPPTGTDGHHPAWALPTRDALAAHVRWMVGALRAASSMTHGAMGLNHEILL